MSVIQTCLQCENTFKARKTPTGLTRFCSRQCSGAFKALPPAVKTCEQCKITFTADPRGGVQKYKVRFCGPKCCTLHRRKRVAKVCEVCGSSYEIARYAENISRYCSRACQKNKFGGRVEKKCGRCGQPFTVEASRGTSSRFCSRQCKYQRVANGQRECTKCRKLKPLAEFSRHVRSPTGRKSTCKGCVAARLAALRLETINIYGGACACCGETMPDFLTVDHINNDGATHRRSINKNCIYSWLKKHGYPKDRFQLLCYNCNLSKGTWGDCPHIKEPAAADLSQSKNIRHARRLKLRTIAAYGGACVCCGESNTYLLTIDHVNNDGAKERREGSGGGSRLYARLARQGYPKDRYRLLCYNCNCAKKARPLCPHAERPRLAAA